MSDGTVTLYLPCAVVHARATLDFGPGVSAVEEIVLRALTVRPMPVEELTTLLGLPRPVVADVVHALWRLGHLTVVPDSGVLVVSPDTADAVVTGRMGVLSGPVREERTLKLVVDALLGQVLPPGTGRRAPQDQRVEPLRGGADLAEISAADLRRAASAALRTDPEPGSGRAAQRAVREHRVLEVHVPEGPVGRYWRPVLVRPWLGQSPGTLGVTVVDPRVPPAAREAGSARLTQLVADRPEAPFTRHLRAQAVSQSLAAPTVKGLADALARRTGRLAGLPAGQLARHHEQLTEAALQLDESVAAYMEHEASVEPVPGDGLVDAAARLIGEARAQVVIVASRLAPPSSRMLEPHLARAVRRGVQVVLLLENDVPVSARLWALADPERRASLLLPRQPAAAHAGLVIRDDEEALVLAGTVLRGDCSLGLRLSAPGGGVCPAVRALLSWVRTEAPDWTTAKAILPRPSWQAPDSAPAGATGFDRLPEPPPDDADGAATAAWEAAWRAYSEGHGEVLRSRSLPHIRWVTGVHLDNLLWHALRTAERRLVIASNRISDRVVDDRFLALLRGRLERGVIVTVAHPSMPRHPRPPGLDALSAEFPETLLLIEAPRGARAVVWDDDSVLPASDPLAPALPASAARPRRSSLGLWLTGAAIADRIAAATGEPSVVTDRVTGRPSAHSGPPQPLTRIRAFNVAQRIRNRWHEGRTTEEALAPLVAEDNPWPVLDCLAGSSVPGGPLLQPGSSESAPGGDAEHELTDGAAADPAVAFHTHGSADDLLCSCVAWCLTHGADRTDTATLDRWRNWLIQHLWLSGRFTEAALLRLGHPSDASPRPSLTVVAAALGTEVSTLALLTALDDPDRSPAEDAALLCVAAAESLRTADDDHMDILKRLVPRVPAPWGNLGDAVLGYHAVARGFPPELLLRPAVDRAGRARRLSSAWTELARAVDRAQRTHSAFVDLRRLQVALFKRSGPFGALEEAAAKRDGDAVRMFLTSHSALDHSDDLTVDSIIDEAWFGVAAGPVTLKGSPRKAFSARLVAIVAAAREVLDAEESLSRRPGIVAASAHQEAVHELAARMQGLSAGLNTAACGLGHPETTLAVHALQQVFRMTEPEVP
ncbi:hypothetical protein ACFCV9_00790 [Streptomyces sp. NPDC056367]|uniref:hypothetical protein n=1 Tax=Streptomyces sp. NPDC056367 TaxID=3345797 RepID=UPI0035DEEC5A